MSFPQAKRAGNLNDNYHCSDSGQAGMTEKAAMTPEN